MKRLIILILILVAVGLAVIYSGIINVAATSPHSPVTEWILGTAMDRSVSNHAADITPPEGWDSQEQLELGAAHYDEMCVVCHGAPGLKETELAKGLLPEPPEMDHAAEEWGPGELFWITKHGIKMTGMPAWGPTHSDKEIWAITAFSKKMIDMTPAEYKQWVEKGKSRHSHGQGHHEMNPAPGEATGATAEPPTRRGMLAVPESGHPLPKAEADQAAESDGHAGHDH